MTTAVREDVHRAAARAALEVPGVAGFQPTLGDLLSRVASRTRHAPAGEAAAGHPVAGIRCRHTPEDGWQVEVRCVLHSDRRVVDIAREVRERVRAAVTARLAQHGNPGPVTVLIAVTRTGPLRRSAGGSPQPSA
ncbi:hypothetical protein ACFWFZ_17855 [Streptomyces sp. NPDC060232]|uniref:hypothetical protein n=1 Tax=Streptomyces sp. NPDC060232 TaxID=3347079 RepID=UPI00364B2E36